MVVKRTVKLQRLTRLAMVVGLVTGGPLSAQTAAPAPAAVTDPADRPNDPVSLRAEAFEAAQSAVTTAAAAALTKVAAAFSKGGGAIAELERKRTDLVHQREAADKQYLDLLGDSNPDRVKVRNEASQRSAALRDQVRGIEDQIAKLNPGYYELTRPRALTVAETQRLLDPDEAILLLLVSDDATYVFGISHDTLEWARTESLNEAALTTKVAHLRDGLQTDADPNRGSVAKAAATEKRATFDRKAAYELYQGLVQPVESVFKGKRVLMTVATGPLGSLPLSLLVTDPPAGTDGDQGALQGTHYLIDRYALATLPAVSSLQALRCLLVAPDKRHKGCGASAGTVARSTARGKVELAGFGAPTLRGAPPAEGTRAAPPGFAKAFKGDLADTDLLRNLPYLAGSKRELDTLGTQFGPARALIRTGAQDTETAVKASTELRQARYVIFSTHGLLAGEGGVQGEPGLVFTPPAEGAKSAIDDGLLTASEAAQLTLVADFVVLSACNTAASDGRPGGEGLSGLARAFFFAGARSLLVSHWQVSDAATGALMSKTFGAVGQPGVRDRAEAVQAAMKAVRGDTAHAWASPGYWAAFTLVGVAE